MSEVLEVLEVMVELSAFLLHRMTEVARRVAYRLVEVLVEVEVVEEVVAGSL